MNLINIKVPHKKKSERRVIEFEGPHLKLVRSDFRVSAIKVDVLVSIKMSNDLLELRQGFSLHVCSLIQLIDARSVARAQTTVVGGETETLISPDLRFSSSPENFHFAHSSRFCE